MKRVTLVSTMCALLAATSATAQTAPAAIFSPLDAAVADSAAASLVATPKGVTDRQMVGMRLDQLFAAAAMRVRLNIDAHDWVAAFERLDADIQGHRVWVGSIEGIPHSHVSFSAWQ